MEEMCFSHFLKMPKDSAARIELGRLFHQEGRVNEKVSESDFVPIWDGTMMHPLLAECQLLQAHRSEVFNLGKGVLNQWCFLGKPQCLEFYAIGSQCKLMNRCVTCVLFGSLKINLAAAFWINCRGLMELAGRPAKRTLQ